MTRDANRRAAEILNDYWENDAMFAHKERAIYNTDNIEILGTKMALGDGPARKLMEEGGLVMMKVMHSSDLKGTWSHDEEGYRVWFEFIKHEEKERTITEEVYTFD